MFAVVLFPLYTAINIFLCYQIIKWLETFGKVFENKITKWIIGIIYTVFALSIPISLFMHRGNLRLIIKLVSNYWLGTFLYMCMIVISAFIVCKLYARIKQQPLKKTTHRIIGLLCVMIIGFMCVYGSINAQNIHTTEYKVTIDKDGGKFDSLKIVLIADLHLGYNIGCEHMEQMVEKINIQNPDVVLLAGDVFDNEYEALDNPTKLSKILSGIESKYGTYAVYGNHDIEEKIISGFTFEGGKKESSEDMDRLLEDANIVRLTDETILIEDSFYICGRPDYSKSGKGVEVRKTASEALEGLDKTKPIIVFEHEPKELNELSEAGADMHLCGHTHDGQIFPGNILCNIVWENSYGHLNKNGMHSIVTSGVGVFGPNMRIGTIAEIVSIDVQFN